MMITVIGRGHSGTRAISHTLSQSGVCMGAQLNESGDLIPPDDMYAACRVLARHVVHRGGTEWDFSRLHTLPIDPEFERLIASFLSSVLQSTAPHKGWKIPETTLILPWIARLFPDNYYIEWVRDPRDSIIGPHVTDDLANFGVPYEPTENLRLRRAISWKYQREIIKATPRPRHWIQVRFEDFVLDQDRTLARLEHYLGFPLARIPVRPESVGRWKTDQEEHDFEFFLDDKIELGYEEPRPEGR